MTFLHFTAGIDDSSRRLDKVLRRFLSEESLSSLYKSLRKGLVKVNGKKCDGSYRLCEGDDIQVAQFLAGKIIGSQRENDKPAKKTEDSLIILKTKQLLFLNKPYDISVQPSSSSKGNSLSELVQGEYESSHKNSSLSFRTGPLHRLDRKTTGIIAFSQNLEGAKWFSEAIKNHRIQKIYLAILQGHLKENQLWEDFIEKRSDSRQFAHSPFHTVQVASEKGKIAHTEVFPLSYGIFEGTKITLARILIKTGRTHQIRSQAAFHGFPLLGDTAYGGKKLDSKKYGQDFFLHASELHFPENNPFELPKVLKAPPPENLLKIISSDMFQRQ